MINFRRWYIFFDLLLSDQVLEIRSCLPHLRAIVVYGEEEVTKGEEGVLSWSDLVRLGNSTSDTNLSARLANIAINQVSKIIYVKLQRHYQCIYVEPSERGMSCAQA